MPAPADAGPAAAGGREMGWHPDPWQRHQVRFYDGAQWTEHVADGGFAGLDTTPVADRPWSRPHPEQEAPPDTGAGPRVLADDLAAPEALNADLLLLDGPAASQARRVLGTDDREVATVAPGRPSLLRRVASRLSVSAPATLTRLVVRTADDAEALTVARPARRTAPVVDVTGPDGRLGVVEASHVRQGLEAEVRAADGTVVGRLTRLGDGPAAPVVVVAPSGAPLARLTPVWDVPGRRRHLPPGMLLVDRRLPPGSEDAAPHRLLLLGALLAPDLLLPPPPSPT